MVNVRVPDVPIIPLEKWTLVSKTGPLAKQFKFVNSYSKAEFVKTLMKYEQKTGHSAKLYVNESTVDVALLTEGVEIVTDVDKKYARFADDAYKDVLLLDN